MNQIPEFLEAKRDALREIAKSYGIDDLRFRNYVPLDKITFENEFIEFYTPNSMTFKEYEIVDKFAQILQMRTYIMPSNWMDPWHAEYLNHELVAV